MSWPALPVFVAVAGRPVILVGEGEAAAAKRRLLERAGAVIVVDDDDARLAIVALDDEAEATAAAARLKARGLLVNVVDRPALCDFTLPAIVDRSPVLVAIGTGGVSAGLAAALRQRLEMLLAPNLGALADHLRSWRDRLRAAFPDPADRRRAIARALAPGGVLDLTDPHLEDPFWLDDLREGSDWTIAHLRLRSRDPGRLTLAEARKLANADRVVHAPDVPAAVLDRARADAPRIVSAVAPLKGAPGLTVWVEMA